MPPFMFFMSYIITPIYIIACILILVAFATLKEIDSEKYFVQGLLLLSAFVILSIALLISVPFVRRKVINAEIERYDFDTSSVEDSDLWDFSTEEFSLKFDNDGMYLNGKLYYYNHMQKLVVTSNSCKRVWIYLQFIFSQEEAIILSLNPKTLKMMQCLNIKPDNQEVLDYILSNKRAAFEKILNKGCL